MVMVSTVGNDIMIMMVMIMIVITFCYQEERFNRKFLLADGRTVSYSIAGVPDGLPVFLFLVRSNLFRVI